MKLMTMLLVAMFALISNAEAQSKRQTLCKTSTPGTDGGDVTFYCQPGERGLLVGTVAELQDWESNESMYWYLRYDSELHEELEPMCRGAMGSPINVRVDGECYTDIQAYHPSVNDGAVLTTTATFGAPLEGGCINGTCGWRMRVQRVHCECWEEGFISPP